MGKKFARVITMVLAALALTACCSQSPTWTQAMHTKMSEFGASARANNELYLRHAGLPYPPKDLAILVFKNTKRMELYGREDSGWKYIRSYPVLAASGGAGPKLHAGDHQVPEGIYHIVGMNPESRFDLSMHLDYPDAFDRKHARADGRRNLGGDIFIHGNHRSIGCVAIGDTAIQQLFPMVYREGSSNVVVVIAPNDLRTAKPIYGKEHPNWLPELYAKLTKKLQQFPLHS